MTFKEILESHGVQKADELIKAMNENKMYISNEENIDIRYAKLKSQNDLSLKTIEDLKKASTSNEELQTKITNYETEIQNLDKKLKESQVVADVKVALLANKATDVDYLLFKLKEKGEIPVDENGKVKDINGIILGLKTQCPTQFENSKTKKVEEKKIEKGDEHTEMTKEEFLKMGYQERANLFESNPELYNELKNN